MRTLPSGAASAALGALLALLLACASTPAEEREAPGSRERSALSLPGQAALAAVPGRVVLISVAGLTPDAYRASRRPSMPTLAELSERGLSADAVVPATPASIYPAHATLVTGLEPDRHGVVGDLLMGERGVREVPYWHASRLAAVPLWQRAREAGLQVGSLGWPSTLGAQIDLLVPDVWPLRSGETWLSLLESASTPWLYQWLRSQQPEAQRQSGAWPNPRQRDALLVGLACEIAASDVPPQLWLLHLAQSGAALSREGPSSQAAHAALGRADAEIRRLLACFGKAGLLESTLVVVVGDRAFAPVHTRVDPNVALWRAGLIVEAPRTEGGILKWSALARSNGRSAFVYARSEQDAVDARKALRDEAKRTGAFRVVSASGLSALHADPQAWFGLEAEPGFRFGDGTRPPAMRAAPERAAAGYLSRGDDGGEVGLVAFGPGIRRVRIARMRQSDLAPTLAPLLGVELHGTDGRRLVGLLTGASPAGGPASAAGAGAGAPKGTLR